MSVLGNTLVQFQTNLGNFEVVLFDDTVPHAVDNFLYLTDTNFYNQTIFHRLEQDFILQGGGYKLSEDALSYTALPLGNSPIETYYRNESGTIAMVPLDDSGDVTSNQWFFNLTDNVTLDEERAGYTVFGQLVDPNDAVFNALASTNTLSFTGFPNLPLINYTSEDASAGEVISAENFLQVFNIQVINEDFAFDYTLFPEVLPEELRYPDTSTPLPSPTPAPVDNDQDVNLDIEGVGSSDFWILFSLTLIYVLRITLRQYHSAKKR